MNFLRSKLPLVIVFFVGMLMIVQFYVPHRIARVVGVESSDWFIIVQGVVLMLGVISLLHTHVQKIRRRQAGWAYSVLVFVGMGAMMAVGFYWLGDESTDNTYTWLYNATIVPLGGTLFSILAFFIASAAYRAFRARNFDATLLLVAAVVVILGRVDIGDLLLRPLVSWLGTGAARGSAWSEFVQRPASGIVEWIMGTPNVAAVRAIRIGVALGIIATSLKIIFGIERSYLGGGK